MAAHVNGHGQSGHVGGSGLNGQAQAGGAPAEAILAVAIGGNSLGGGKFSLAGSIIGAYTIQALTTTLYAMHVSSDQVPVYKAIVVVIIVALQSPGFAKWRKSLAQKKDAQMNAGKEAA